MCRSVPCLSNRKIAYFINYTVECTYAEGLDALETAPQLTLRYRCASSGDVAVFEYMTINRRHGLIPRIFREDCLGVL